MESQPQNPEFKINPENFHQCFSEPGYKRTIIERNYRKMTNLWSFSYNSFVKINRRKYWS